MKANLDENGKLSIIPETSTEAFALSNWDMKKHVLMILTEVPRIEVSNEES